MEEASPNAVTLPASLVKSVKTLLEVKGFIDKSRKIGPFAGCPGRCAIPISLEAATAMQSSTIFARDEDFAPFVSDMVLVFAILPSNKQRQQNGLSRAARLQVALKNAVQDADTAFQTLLDLDESEGGLPSKYEWVGDIIMIPEKAFTSKEWGKYIEAEKLWKLIAEVMRAERVARKAEIVKNSKRESAVQILFASETRKDMGGWVEVKENGLTYTFDVSKVMFSSGNVTEKARMGKIGCAGETIVDLFCGIGYYVVPMLVHGKAAKIYACEQNPNSLEALRKNLCNNKVQDRCEILAGDNRETALPKLSGLADRVLLGLLPSSEGAWAIAVACLKPRGGVLHVHANVATAETEAWTQRLLKTIQNYAEECGRSCDSVELVHLERVKSYAPHVFHVVADVWVKTAAAAEGC